MSEDSSATTPATSPVPHLYLIDGSGYIFRAYHRLPPLTNRHGQPAGAVYGYTAMLWKLVDSLHKADGPTHLAVILDKSSKTHRNDMYAEYKAHRPPPPPDLVPQFPMIRDATRAFSLPCIETEGLEADDIIACYSGAALAAGWQVTIVSSDKDLMQMIEPGRLDMLDTMNDRRLDTDYVVGKFGVPPHQLGEVLALMGDSVDNIPGVPGIGPKTAAELIQKYGTVEDVLAHAHEIAKPKLRQSLIDHADAARMSRELVKLVCDVDLPQPLDSLEMKGIPDAPLRAFLEEQGFKSLLTRMSVMGTGQAETAEVKAEPKAPVTVDRKAYETIIDEAALDRWIGMIQAAGYVALDTETTDLDSMRADLVGISLCVEPGVACYIPLIHGGGDLLGEAPPQLPLDLVIGRLKPLLEDPAILKIGHNFKYDWIMLARHGVNVAPVDDTMLMSFDLDAGKHNHGMDELAKLHFEHACIAFSHVCGTGRKQITFDKVPLAEATEYAAEDADITYRLWQLFKPRLAAEHATRVYEMVDRPLVSVIGNMEREGILVDREELGRLSAEFQINIAALEKRIYEAAQGPFTIGSPQQLGSVLYDRLGLKGGRKGKSGTYSTDINELERLAAEGVPVARLVVEWRQLTKLKNTYTDALQASINPTTGRVHTSYSLAAAQTGRLSSNDPNLQNIPIRTETGRRIRNAFVADPGHVLLSADYSQIELRLAAHMADVPQLRQAFAEGTDIHSLTAQELFGDAERDSRSKAKTINFAILYGISSWGLAGRLSIGREEAQDMIDRYFARFPGIKNYIADTLSFVREHGYTQTLFGRKTWFRNIASKQMNERQGAERAAINAPIQGTCADIIKRAMIRMPAALAEAGLTDVRMLLQVHDELVFEVPEGREDAASGVIRRVMERAAEPAVPLSVPLGVEVGSGRDWGSAH